MIFVVKDDSSIKNLQDTRLTEFMVMLYDFRTKILHEKELFLEQTLIHNSTVEHCMYPLFSMIYSTAL